MSAIPHSTLGHENFTLLSHENGWTSCLIAYCLLFLEQVSAKDNKVLWALVTGYGGQYQTLLNCKVTHLVTTSAKGVGGFLVCLFL